MRKIVLHMAAQHCSDPKSDNMQNIVSYVYAVQTHPEAVKIVKKQASVALSSSKNACLSVLRTLDQMAHFGAHLVQLRHIDRGGY